MWALDCNAPPIFVLMTEHKDDVYAYSTFAYQVTKEQLGFLSLLWHVHVSRCIYSWIVLKVSAVRLRRPPILLFLLVTAAIAVARYFLEYDRRVPGMLDLYLSILLYNVVLVPATVVVIVRYYVLTLRVLRGACVRAAWAGGAVQGRK